MVKGEEMGGRDIHEIAADLSRLIPLVKKKLVENGRSLDEFGLAHSSAQVLFVVEDRGPLLAAELARRLSVSPSNAAPIVRRLEARGLVGRVHDAADRRRVRIGLTAKGRRLLTRVRAALDDELAERLSPFAARELARFSRSLVVVRDFLERLE